MVTVVSSKFAYNFGNFKEESKLLKCALDNNYIHFRSDWLVSIKQAVIKFLMLCSDKFLFLSVLLMMRRALSRSRCHVNSLLLSLSVQKRGCVEIKRRSQSQTTHRSTLKMELTKNVYFYHTSYGWASLWYGSRCSAQLSCWDSNFGFFLVWIFKCSSRTQFCAEIKSSTL